MKPTDISILREEYTKMELSESSIAEDPFQQFGVWFEQAKESQVQEPNAMTLATVDVEGKPSARVVLLKGYGQEGFYFYTNYKSDKAKDLENNPFASVVFLFLPLERQVRIKGSVVKVSRDKSAEYFRSRPRGSQIGAWASPQSQIISNRNELEEKLETLEKEFEGMEHIPLPENWGGYLIIPESIEFWQGRRNRLHDRIRYRNESGNWIIERLAP